MNFKSITQFLKRTSTPHVNIPLGRWNIHNYRETVIKIKYANEDNCGVCCHNYKNIKEYIYIMGYESVH